MKKLLLLVVYLFIQNTAFSQKICFYNGKIYTVDARSSVVEAVVVENGRIIFVGSTPEARAAWSDSRTKMVNLEGKLMLPGFIDNHTHFADGGMYLLGIDLRNAKSTTQFKEIIKKYVESHRGEWIKSGNWDHESWEVKELPTKEMIDDFSIDTPIFIDRFDGHTALANSKALALAGITKETKSPDGGEIVTDPKTGEPTGILKDAAMNLVYSIIPQLTPEQKLKCVHRALQEARENGITSVHDITFKPDLLAFQALEKEDKLTCRFYTRLPIDSYQNLVGAGIQAGFGSNKIKLGSLKAYADGSLGSSTALMFKPYDQNPNTKGLASDIVINGKLNNWAMDTDKNHLQLSIHAIGDSANYLMLKLFEEITKTNPKWDRRFRIEHAQHVRLEDIPLFAKLGVIASVQPYHCIDDGVWAAKRIGNRVDYTHPYKSFLDAGIKLCMGSDWSVAPLNAILGIYAAVTRQTVDGGNPMGWIPKQKISVADAIKGYTINNAFAAFEEKEKGSIEPGKLADMVVLSDDILTIKPEKIQNVKVLMTIFDGKIVYEKK
ncbi:amidohydrolase [Arcicella sp. LKC2W]|uniref:amidohydrolase n=1 Tax=Arcicella sp. LKC2W TaxID=2984198 RepID=UPI002B1E9AE0|nr:amidohydrolase [Arcicella sp. LKC2W]MEA5461225.1 amidohydrolase [Arcicella sp. LKC2W]